MNLVRILISLFVGVLLALVALGWVWTGSNQPAPSSTASHVVLGIAGLAGLGTLVKLWVSERPRVGAGR